MKYKLEIPPILADADKPDAAERAKLYIAELKHGGGSNIAPTALVNLLKQLSLDTGLRVSTEKRELSPLQDEVFDHHLVFMHGRSSFSFSDAERKQLRLFVERGGLIFADAICSSEEFTSSFRREMGQVFPDAPLRPIAASHEMFGEKFGGFPLGQVTLRDPRRGNGAGPLRSDVIRTSPELEGVQLGNRFGVIFSKYALSCALDLSREGLIRRARSASYVPKDGPRYDQLLRHLDRLWEDHHDESGLVSLGYPTFVWRVDFPASSS